MKVAIGFDPNAIKLRETLITTIHELGHECVDRGGDDQIYANVAIDVAQMVAAGKYDRAILVCGTGIGMCISANKVQGAFAALAGDTYSAEKAVTSNNANILCLGAQTIGEALAQRIVSTYLQTIFKEGTLSDAKLARYVEYDSKYR